MDCSLPGSSVHRIFQARILEWVAIPYSRGSSQPRDQISYVHCSGRGILYHRRRLGSPYLYVRVCARVCVCVWMSHFVAQLNAVNQPCFKSTDSLNAQWRNLIVKINKPTPSLRMLTCTPFPFLQLSCILKTASFLHSCITPSWYTGRSFRCTWPTSSLDFSFRFFHL